jgi:hypothetical protein
MKGWVEFEAVLAGRGATLVRASAVETIEAGPDLPADKAMGPGGPRSILNRHLVVMGTVAEVAAKIAEAEAIK